MRKYFFIASGGFAGAIIRFWGSSIKITSYSGNLPLNTLIINVTGCFLLSLFLTLAFDLLEFDPDVRTGISTGFFGAYTTFSTLCKETVALINNGYYLSASLYILLSAFVGISFAYLGNITAKKIISQKGGVS